MKISQISQINTTLIKYIRNFIKSVQSIHPCQSAIQTNFVILKANGGVPISIAIETIGIKVVIKEKEHLEFIIKRIIS